MLAHSIPATLLAGGSGKASVMCHGPQGSSSLCWSGGSGTALRGDQILQRVFRAQSVSASALLQPASSSRRPVIGRKPMRCADRDKLPNVHSDKTRAEAEPWACRRVKPIRDIDGSHSQPEVCSSKPGMQTESREGPGRLCPGGLANQAPTLRPSAGRIDHKHDPELRCGARQLGAASPAASMPRITYSKRVLPSEG